MRRHFKKVVVLVVISLIGCGAIGLYRELISRALVDTTLEPTQRVQAFYYPWYGNPTHDAGHWYHWNDNGHSPPEDIDAGYYPQLGAYSSRDRAVVAQHMKWAKQAGIGVLIYSWWGRNNYINANVTLVMEEAAKQNIKIAWIIEPYAGWSPATVTSDIHYLYDTYGNSPAFFRVARPTKYGNSNAPRGLFYVFGSTSTTNTALAGQWRTALDTLHADASYNAIVLGVGEDACFVDGCNDLNRESHFDGLFLYAGSPVYALGYPDMKAALDSRNSLFIPTTIPGFDSSRDRAGDPKLLRFNHGQYCVNSFTYDCTWAGVIKTKPEWATITSFNEWHESTNIEPAVAKTITNFTYKNYTDEIPGVSSTFYIDKTTVNVVKYLAALGISWSPPAVNAASPAITPTPNNSSITSNSPVNSSQVTHSADEPASPSTSSQSGGSNLSSLESDTTAPTKGSTSQQLITALSKKRSRRTYLLSGIFSGLGIVMGTGFLVHRLVFLPRRHG